jgi:peptidoglycan/xylan/chitin deacetylase (PgdA/CDA1 family)
MMTFAWPGDRIAAISLTFDDGMASQLEVGVPLLNHHGVAATFYVNPGDEYRTQLAPWRAAFVVGHEIGNHTVRHPCSQNFDWISDTGRRSLEEMSWEEMGAEIDEAGRRIADVIPEQGLVSFAYPCYQPFLGRGAQRRSYVPLVLERCVAGRGRGERANDPRFCDLGYLWSFPCERMDGAHLIGLVEQTAAQGRWAILTFHGIHEGHLAVAEGDLEELCAYLARHRQRIWTAPLAEIAGYVAVHQTQGAPM